jgi:hypothetical protein
MRLRDLDGQFVHNAHAGGYFIRGGDSVDGAQGVLFQCPSCGVGKPHGCDSERNYIEGDHYILVFFANPHGAEVASPAADANPRWTMSGTTLDDLTLSPSVDCTKGGGCSFHGWVTNGEAT